LARHWYIIFLKRKFILGQQQLLLIILGVIIVGIAILLGIVLFRQNSIEHKRDMVINEGMTIANNAMAYYKKPTTLGGGQNSFTGWKIPTQMSSGSNGSYIATVNSDNVEIIGTGNEVVSGTDSVKVKFTVTATSIVTSIIN
jgi:hypothetical protein